MLRKSMSHVCNDNYRIFCPSRTSNKQYTLAPQGIPTQRSVIARLRYRYLEAKGGRSEDSLCSATRIRVFPKNALIDRNIFTTARKINWPHSFTENTSKQNCSKPTFWCSSSVKFVSAAMSVQCQKERKDMCLVYQYIYDPTTLRFLSRYSRGLETFFFGRSTY